MVVQKRLVMRSYDEIARSYRTNDLMLVSPPNGLIANSEECNVHTLQSCTSNLKSKDACYRDHTDGTSDVHAALIPREGTRLGGATIGGATIGGATIGGATIGGASIGGATTESDRLNGVPRLVALGRVLVEGLLEELDRIRGVGGGIDPAQAVKACFDGLEDGV